MTELIPFARASAALRDRDFAWCRAHDIRYVVIDGKIVRLR